MGAVVLLPTTDVGTHSAPRPRT